jgi:hypothetical protein
VHADSGAVRKRKRVVCSETPAGSIAAICGSAIVLDEGSIMPSFARRP